jgi:lysophospholipase L1-like esterase
MWSSGKIRALVGGAMVATVAGVLAPIGQAPAGASDPTPYYVALGDSLSQGVQPNALGQSVETSHGYADDLYAVYKHQVPGLQLEKLGCPGETSTSMLTGSGSPCTYTAGSQLAQAVAFISTHHVVLVTLDIGANDVDGCVAGGSVNEGCIATGLANIAGSLPPILYALRAAAGASVPIVGMNYYDPFLAFWLQGAAGQALATSSVGLAALLNGSVLGPIYSAFGDPVADVQSAFQTTNFTPLPIIALPVNVALICALTWMCAPPPVGPNIHANVFGYSVITGAFIAKIGLL